MEVNKFPLWVRALLSPEPYAHPVTDIQIIETHISWVLLTGTYAYKIKKPLDLGFLDFSSLEKRRFYCQEEVRLNQRLAPQIYLGVIPICGTPVAPVLEGKDQPFEYAIKMRQFDPNQQLDVLLAKKRLKRSHIDTIAEKLCQFHSHIEIAPQESVYGSPSAVIGPVIENFQQIRPSSPSVNAPRLDKLENWSLENFETLKPILEKRKALGHIRECHGDLHLRNVAIIDNEIVFLDCLEFNEGLRWIDTISELAFITMDLEQQGARDFSLRLLNRYLELTGDYEAVSLVHFYWVYRAMVRAKVHALRLQQAGLSEQERKTNQRAFENYLTLAERYTQQQASGILVTHGFSGSGKTTYTERLIETHNAIRVRSDIERKRLFGLSSYDRTGSEVGEGLYSAENTEKTYTQLAQFTEYIVQARFSAVVDAAFLKKAERIRFHELARKLHVSYMILDFRAPADILRQRILARQREGTDASEADLAVLEHQWHSHEPLDAVESKQLFPVDWKTPPPFSEVWATLDLCKTQKNL